MAMSFLIYMCIGNAVARKSAYRMTLIYRFPQIRCLDARDITDEDREKACAFFDATPPGIMLAQPIPPACPVAFPMPGSYRTGGSNGSFTLMTSAARQNGNVGLGAPEFGQATVFDRILLEQNGYMLICSLHLLFMSCLNVIHSVVQF